MAPNGDRFWALPDEMARTARQLSGPGDLLRHASADLRSELDGLGRIWGEGDSIADALEEKLAPRIEQLDFYLDLLATAFDQVEDRVLDSASSFQRGEDEAALIGDALNPGAPDLVSGAGAGRR